MAERNFAHIMNKNRKFCFRESVNLRLLRERAIGYG
nr:MAG TPA: hypothetical protein [Caudoviricetes sp.]